MRWRCVSRAEVRPGADRPGLARRLGRRRGVGAARAAARGLSVVVTIHDDDEHLFPALQAGAFGYILKEQPRELITEQLQRISQGEPPLSPSIARTRASRTSRRSPSRRPDAAAGTCAHRARERGAAARGQGLHAARDRRAARPVAPHRSPTTSSRSTASSTSARAPKPRSRRSAWAVRPRCCRRVRLIAAIIAGMIGRLTGMLAEKAPPQVLVDVQRRRLRGRRADEHVLQPARRRASGSRC